KDVLIYLVIIVAVLYIPAKLGGWGDIFDAAKTKFDKTPAPGDGITIAGSGQLNYAMLALGSAMALFLYPHSITGVLASRSRNVIKRNMAALPAYSFVLGLIALLGYMAIAAGVKPVSTNGKPDTNTVVPLLFDHMFPDWFAGVAFAAVGIGALVPAAIMSIAAANLFTRNIYKEYINRDATAKQEATVSKLVSLIVKAGAVVCILALDPQFSIDLQLIGGVIILQTLPAVGLGLLTRWFHRGALIAGWAAGMTAGLWMLYQIPNPAKGKEHFGGSAYPLSDLGLDTKMAIYTGMLALAVNVVVAIAGTLVCRAAKLADGEDATRAADYLADEGDPKVKELDLSAST
ncbi:sodium:solute symporter, partial [Spirillospora sp. NPDC049024]